MRIVDLKQRLFYFLARTFQRWAESSPPPQPRTGDDVPTDATSAGPRSASGAGTPLPSNDAMSIPACGGPPAHWVEKVRQAAPQLLQPWPVNLPIESSVPVQRPVAVPPAEETREEGYRREQISAQVDPKNQARPIAPADSLSRGPSIPEVRTTPTTSSAAAVRVSPEPIHGKAPYPSTIPPCDVMETQQPNQVHTETRQRSDTPLDPMPIAANSSRAWTDFDVDDRSNRARQVHVQNLDPAPIAAASANPDSVIRETGELIVASVIAEANRPNDQGLTPERRQQPVAIPDFEHRRVSEIDRPASSPLARDAEPIVSRPTHEAFHRKPELPKFADLPRYENRVRPSETAAAQYARPETVRELASTQPSSRVLAGRSAVATEARVASTAEELWPELPPLIDDEQLDDSLVFFRERERLHRIDCEQRGMSWSE